MSEENTGLESGLRHPR